jgi:hypothetical protein
MPEEVVSPSHDDGHLQRVDPAALLGAAVAAVLTITLAEGAWWWLDVIIGITLGFVLFAYAPTLSAQPKLARRQAAAFGGWRASASSWCSGIPCSGLSRANIALAALNR